jgi:hypothetical protein
MKKLLMIFMAAGFFTSGCRKIEVDGSTITTTTTSANENTILEGRITENRTLKAQNTYKLRGLVYVTNGAVLTIEPGTKIVGENGRNGGLIITRNAKINADGTADKPIVFTSEAATPQRGDWAGVVLLGNAPTNASFNGQAGVGEIEGGINNSEGMGLYGGTNPADNSGVLRYVRIEYAGYAFLPDKEINSITFGGVGNQTIVDYVQVSYANDDAFEWFGGTVNCKHLISHRTLDDDFDSDNGFAGKVQFAIALRDSAIADVSKSEAIESDNDANGSSATPLTAAVFSNMTLLGPKVATTTAINSNYLGGAQIRRNSSVSIINSIIAGWPQGLLIDASKGIPTDNNLSGASPTLVIQNNIIAGCAQPVVYSASSTAPTGTTTASILAWYSTAAFSNTILASNTDVGLTAPFNYTTPDFNPSSATSPAATGASFVHPKSSGLQQVPYKGACAVGDTWWKGWTRY